MERLSPTRWPAVSLSTPFGRPVSECQSNATSAVKLVQTRTCSPTCVNDVHAVIRPHRHTLRPNSSAFRTSHHLVPIPLSSVTLDRIPSELIALPHDDLLRLEAALLYSSLDHRLIARRAFGTIDTARSSHYHPRRRGLDPLGQGSRGKASKDDRVDRAETGNSKQGEECLGYHRHYPSLAHPSGTK